MVDKIRRKKLALHLRQLSTGLISNDEFESNIMDDVTFNWSPEQYYRAIESKTDDSVIRPILELSWSMYDDVHNHKMKGKDKLSTSQLKQIARYILFLRSDLEYEWTYVDIISPIMRFSFKEILKSITTFGKYYRDQRIAREKELELMKKEGDFEYWPFKTKTDFENQLQFQPFLNAEAVSF